MVEVRLHANRAVLLLHDDHLGIAAVTAVGAFDGLDSNFALLTAANLYRSADVCQGKAGRRRHHKRFFHSFLGHVCPFRHYKGSLIKRSRVQMGGELFDKDFYVLAIFFIDDVNDLSSTTRFYLIGQLFKVNPLQLGGILGADS